MKPIELEPSGIVVSGYGRLNINSYSDTMRTYIPYREQDCVIAYRKSFMGTAMIIKGVKEMFGFLFLNQGIGKWGDIELQRKKLRDMRKIFDTNSDIDKLVIVNEELYKLFERKVLFESI